MYVCIGKKIKQTIDIISTAFKLQCVCGKYFERRQNASPAYCGEIERWQLGIKSTNDLIPYKYVCNGNWLIRNDGSRLHINSSINIFSTYIFYSFIMLRSTVA